MIDTPVNVIDTRGLGKTFGGIQALNDLNLRVPKNSIFGFLGPNGAGKTTTIKLLLGLIWPSAGGGSVFDQELPTIGTFLPSDSGLTLAPALMFGEPLPSLAPLFWTAGFSILFLVIGVWKFKRAEL